MTTATASRTKSRKGKSTKPKPTKVAPLTNESDLAPIGRHTRGECRKYWGKRLADMEAAIKAAAKSSRGLLNDHPDRMEDWDIVWGMRGAAPISGGARRQTGTFYVPVEKNSFGETIVATALQEVPRGPMFRLGSMFDTLFDALAWRNDVHSRERFGIARIHVVFDGLISKPAKNPQAERLAKEFPDTKEAA